MTNNIDQAYLNAQLFHSLRSFERRARAQLHTIPTALGGQEHRRGIAYTLGGVSVLSMMNEIREIIPFPERLTSVPGSRDWVLGLTNIRGELLPIVDLQHFVGFTPAVPGEQARVMVIRSQGMSTGLLVESVLGMRHFSGDRRIPGAVFEGVPGNYVYDVFDLEDGMWPVFSMAALVNDTRFMTGAG